MIKAKEITKQTLHTCEVQNSDITIIAKKAIEITDKELEVLEILREHLVLIPTGTNKEQLYIATDITNYLSEKDKEKFNKVKQWLEE